MALTCTIIFAFALLLQFTAHSTMALPKAITDQEMTDQDRVISMTGDDVNELSPGLLSFRGYPVIRGRLEDEDGTKRIFILADTPGRETKAFGNAFPKTIPALRGMDRNLDGFGMRVESRSADDVIPVGRRDIDILRCMIGRVYRPCWQA